MNNNNPGESLSLRNYKTMDKIGKSIAYFFVALMLIITFTTSSFEYIDQLLNLSLLLALIGAGIIFYNDYRYKKYKKMAGRVVNMFLIFLLAAIYWFLQS